MQVGDGPNPEMPRPSAARNTVKRRAVRSVPRGVGFGDRLSVSFPQEGKKTKQKKKGQQRSCFGAGSLKKGPIVLGGLTAPSPIPVNAGVVLEPRESLQLVSNV